MLVKLGSYYLSQVANPSLDEDYPTLVKNKELAWHLSKEEAAEWAKELHGKVIDESI